MAATTAGLIWAVMDWIINRHPTVLGIITGAVAGLVAVAIKPVYGLLDFTGALGVGIGSGGVICYLSVAFVKTRFSYDDSLDAFGVHGIGGIRGAIAIGLWATKAVNSAGADGLFYGNPAQRIIQIKAVLLTIVYAFIVSFILLKLVDFVLGLRRVSDHAETYRAGLKWVGPKVI